MQNSLLLILSAVIAVALGITTGTTGHWNRPTTLTACEAELANPPTPNATMKAEWENAKACAKGCAKKSFTVTNAALAACKNKTEKERADRKAAFQLFFTSAVKAQVEAAKQTLQQCVLKNGDCQQTPVAHNKSAPGQEKKPEAEKPEHNDAERCARKATREALKGLKVSESAKTDFKACITADNCFPEHKNKSEHGGCEHHRKRHRKHGDGVGCLREFCTNKAAIKTCEEAFHATKKQIFELFSYKPTFTATDECQCVVAAVKGDVSQCSATSCPDKDENENENENKQGKKHDCATEVAGQHSAVDENQNE